MGCEQCVEEGGAYRGDEGDEVDLVKGAAGKIRHEGFFLGLVAVAHLPANVRSEIASTLWRRVHGIPDTASKRPRPRQPADLVTQYPACGLAESGQGCLQESLAGAA